MPKGSIFRDALSSTGPEMPLLRYFADVSALADAGGYSYSLMIAIFAIFGFQPPPGNFGPIIDAPCRDNNRTPPFRFRVTLPSALATPPGRLSARDVAIGYCWHKLIIFWLA